MEIQRSTLEPALLCWPPKWSGHPENDLLEPDLEYALYDVPGDIEAYSWLGILQTQYQIYTEVTIINAYDRLLSSSYTVESHQ